MRRLFKTGATKALIGVSIACALASPALAAKPASGRHYAHHDTDKRNTCALCLAHLSLQWRALYTGWGCDYYVYSEPYALRRR
jgi:hypothetical protein